MEKSIFIQKRDGWILVNPKDPEIDALVNLFEELKDLGSTEVTVAGEKTKVVGDSTWTILNSKDPTVIEIGKFAVAEHNKKAGTKLVFVEVVSHSKLGVLKFYFHVLTIRTNDGVHKALVFEAPFGYKKLLFWIN